MSDASSQSATAENATSSNAATQDSKADNANTTSNTTDTASSASSSAASSASSTSAVASSHPRLLNVNVGILGHVDSGKSSLAKALSTTLSTAALDKLPASQQRGITLDLGFSSFCLPVVPGSELAMKYDEVQVTLVDMPGHATLIRTIIGGAGIIDLMLLVLDVTKGMQTQSAECLVIGEILADRLIVVLNKVDLLSDREKQLPKIEKGLRQVFAGTKFGRDVIMVPCSANPGSVDDLKVKEGGKSHAAAAASAIPDESKPTLKPEVGALLAALRDNLAEPSRTASSESNPFLFSVDHCFQVKGSGTVLTGTVLSGQVKLNQMIELPALKLERKVKSMQMFRRPIDMAIQGDRCGICVTQLDSKLVERGLVCSPGSVGTYDSIIAVVDKVRFFKAPCLNKAKFHVSIGHSTAMATAHFFGGPAPKYDDAAKKKAADGSSSTSASSSFSSSATAAPPARVAPKMQFNFDQDYAWRGELLPVSNEVAPHTQFAVLQFDKPVQCPIQSVLIGSRLDADIHLNSCRIAFSGRFLTGIQWDNAVEREKLRVYKLKEKVGMIDRVVDEYTLIGRDLFQKGTDLNLFVGMKIELEDGTKGKIESSFGQGGKFKAVFLQGLPGVSSTAASSSASSGDAAAAKGKGKPKTGPTLKGKIFLRFRKYMYAQEKKTMVQD